jgi:UDP-glucose 4-epimerase
MRLLVTGSSGFLGGSIGRLAKRDGHDILGVSRSPALDGGWPGEFVQLDVSDPRLLSVIRDFAPDIVWHTAGPASVNRSVEAPLVDLQAALLPWANTLDCIRRARLRPLVIFPSSAAVYGEPASVPVREEAQIAPISPYGFHKVACEVLAREYAKCSGLNVVICRLFSTLGAAQKRLLIWELYEQLIGPESTVWLQGSGTEGRDYLGIDDLWSALARLIQKKVSPADSGRFFVVNIASGTEICTLNVAEQLRDLIAPSKAIRCRDIARPSDPRRWRADVSRLRSLLPEWQPQPLSSALAKCVGTWQKERAFAAPRS